jgi:hypothetical protein
MKAPKKFTVNQRLSRVEKAIGELYILIHRIVEKIEPTEKQEDVE